MNHFNTSIDALIAWTLSPVDRHSPIDGPARSAANGPAA
jgi:hypothetical protein